MRKIFNKSAFVVALVLVFTTVISCEEDFTDIKSSVISNTKFDVSSLIVDEVSMTNGPVTSLVSDNISVQPGLYLLGVYATAAYEKIEASLVSQLAISTTLKVIDDENIYLSDTTVVTTIDTVFIKLPYQVTLNSTGTAYELDSIIGDQSKGFNLKVFESNTFLSALDPDEPSKLNSYLSDDVFEKKGSELNTDSNFKLFPKATDTAIVVKRWLSNNTLSSKDTVTYTNSTSTVPLPFALIPLKEDEIKKIFLDEYESSVFDSQVAFNNYFRGVILEASGNEGSLISFNFNGTVRPSLEIYYTNTVLVGDKVIDTISKNNSFLLSGIRAATYKMEDKVYPVDNNVVLQGAAGSEGVIDLFGADTNGSGVADKIEELRERNLLINDASLTVYINQSIDTTAVPYQLFLYESDEEAIPTYSQVKDVFSEGAAIFGGLLERDSDGNKEKYTFRITDYISDILSGEIDASPALRLKVINSTDLQTVTNTVFKNYNWNPKAVTLLNHSAINGDKKMELKISYSEKQTNKQTN